MPLATSATSATVHVRGQGVRRMPPHTAGAEPLVCSPTRRSLPQFAITSMLVPRRLAGSTSLLSIFRRAQLTSSVSRSGTSIAPLVVTSASAAASAALSPSRSFTSSSHNMSPAPAWSEWRMNVPSATPIDSTTVRNQSKLPKLPIPELDVTLDKVLESCKPLAKDQAEYDELAHKVEQFRGGIGQELQKRLKERRESEGMRNWIAEWWDNDAYMAYRDSIVVNVSYYYGFKKLPQAPSSASEQPDSDPAYVAASIVTTALEFRRLLIKGLLEPEPAGTEGELCMESYKWAYNANRIPAKPADYAVKVAEDSPEGQHIVVVLKNNYYRVPTSDKNGRQYTVEELRRTFQQIFDRGDRERQGVGILTGINRDAWTDAYEHLIRNRKNKHIIDEISKSAFVVAFDQHKPDPRMFPIDGNEKSLTSEGIKDFSERLWKAGGAATGIGEGANRWWDKPQQWVVFANGESGFIGEHSCMDGTPTARLSDFVSKRLLTRQPVEVGSEDPAPKESPAIEKLRFVLDAKAEEMVEEGKKEFLKHVGAHEVHYMHYGRYGKEGIKKMKTSPDAWTQMVFQLAYHMTHGKPCGTYEAAQVRRFQLGRTETVRICTSATLDFTKAMLSSSSSASEKRALFTKAVGQHGVDMKAASAGLGIDRHLFGLRHLVKPDESAPLLNDPLLKRSSTWTMSTSQIFIENAPAYGWGRVDPNGYGIPYMIHKDYLQFTVTCENHMPGKEFITNLGKAADMIMDMMESTAEAKP